MIVDDHVLLREAVRAALERGGMDVVGEASSVEEAERVAMDTRPDVLLLDIDLPDGSGIDLVGRLVPRLPNSRFLMLTVSATPEDVHEAIRLGADGYLGKDISSESLVRAIHGVSIGEFAMPRRLARSLVRILAASAAPTLRGGHDELNSLTERERVILGHLAHGRTSSEIAEALGLSPRTVEGYVGTILRKLGVRNRAEAAAHYRARTG